MKYNDCPLCGASFRTDGYDENHNQVYVCTSCGERFTEEDLDTMEDAMGEIIDAARLYDRDGNEVGLCDNNTESIAYAFANSKGVYSARFASPLFGQETVIKNDIPETALREIRNRHELGRHLIFYSKEIVNNL